MHSMATPAMSIFLNSTNGKPHERLVDTRRGCLKCSSKRLATARPGLPRLVQRGAVVMMGIKAVENFDTSFELQPSSEETLVKLLSSDVFAKQVAEQPGAPSGSPMVFTGHLFPPVPWSPNTRFGMPLEFEPYLADKENYVIVNVPPNYMFQAKIFKPARLCAIFGQQGAPPPPQAKPE